MSAATSLVMRSYTAFRLPSFPFCRTAQNESKQGGGVRLSLLSNSRVASSVDLCCKSRRISSYCELEMHLRERRLSRKALSSRALARRGTILSMTRSRRVHLRSAITAPSVVLLTMHHVRYLSLQSTHKYEMNATDQQHNNQNVTRSLTCFLDPVICSTDTSTPEVF